MNAHTKHSYCKFIKDLFTNMLLDCLGYDKQETEDCERKKLRCDHKLSTSSPSLSSRRQLNATSLHSHLPLTQDPLPIHLWQRLKRHFKPQKQIYLFMDLRRKEKSVRKFILCLARAAVHRAPFFNATLQRKRSCMQTVPQEEFQRSGEQTYNFLF